MSSLFYLSFLVQKKNELNRARRRAYHAMRPLMVFDFFKVVPGIRNGTWEKRRPGNRQAKKDYKRLQREMKAMTPHMRAVRTELGARFIWGSSGNIRAIVLENKWYYSKEIARLSDHHMIDSILLS